MNRTKLRKTLDISYDDALAKIPAVLADEGFGVLTRVDLGETVKAQLGVTCRRYTMFGALNPALVHRALCADPEVGVLLPCNVAVYEDDAGKAVVAILDPLEMVEHDGEAALREIAAETRTKLGHALFRMH